MPSLRTHSPIPERSSSGNEDAVAKCPICGSKRKPLYLWNGFHLSHCGACETESVYPQPKPEVLAAFYQQISAKKMNRWQTRLKLIKRAFDRYLKEFQQVSGREKPTRFLDVGGGVGYYVRAAQDQGIEACLMDYAGDAMQFACETLKVRTSVCGDIQKCADFFGADSACLIIFGNAL